MLFHVNVNVNVVMSLQYVSVEPVFYGFFFSTETLLWALHAMANVPQHTVSVMH